MLIPGAAPEAGNFLLRGQEKVTKEKAAPVHRHHVVSLCCSPRPAAVELALVIRTRRELRQSSPTTPALAATARGSQGLQSYSVATRRWGRKSRELVTFSCLVKRTVGYGHEPPIPVTFRFRDERSLA